MRIAIVGTGVSGLVAAHLLKREHDVVVYEARDRIGGHVHTIEVEGVDDRPVRVDTGFIVYNEHNYPLFTRLIGQLDVMTQPSNMSFSVKCDRTGIEYNGSTLRQIFAQKRNLLRPSFHRMLRDILRFNREAGPAIANGAAGLTLGEYVRSAGYSEGLCDLYLLPMGSALWSVPRDQVLEMPAAFFVSFFENHGMLTVDDRPEWRVIVGGSDAYLKPLVDPFRDAIRTSTAVTSVSRADDHVLVNGERFDDVVFACHSDQALTALDDATPGERELLGSLPYQSNDVVLHTDSSVLPRRTNAWGSWNYHIRGGDDGPATVTYNMNMLQTLSGPETYCVTLNATDTIDPSAILYRTTYHHPIYTNAGFDAQARHAEISGVNRTHYCGAYWGFGFHEDGVRSGVRVAEHFGISL
ncbi:MAG: NAD(P)/FAD-dependent oxidoreductase [Longimicrobiales bacterium]